MARNIILKAVYTEGFSEKRVQKNQIDLIKTDSQKRNSNVI